MVTFRPEVEAWFIEQEAAFPFLLEREIEAVKDGAVTALDQEQNLFAQLVIAKPDLVDKLFAGLILALSSPSAAPVIESHRQTGDSESWLHSGVANAFIRSLHNVAETVKTSRDN